MKKIMAVLFLVIIAAFPFYYFFQKEIKKIEIENESKFIECQKNNSIDEIAKKNEVADAKAEEVYKKEKVDISNIEWLTYKNVKHRFEIKYPSDWNLEEPPGSAAGAIFRSPNYDPVKSGQSIFKGEIYVSVMENKNNTDILTRMKSFNDSSSFWPEREEHYAIIAGEYKGIIFPEIKGRDYSQTEVMLKADRKLVTFSYSFKEKNMTVAKIFERMIESIKIY